MNEPKDHHYVPAFYLNYWGKPKDKSKYKEVQCFGFQGGYFISSRKRTKHICSYRGLNLRESNQNKEIYKIENLFSVIDSKASIVHKKIINKGPYSLSNIERSYYASFLMSLYVRQPDVIKEMKEYGRGYALKELSDPIFIEKYQQLNTKKIFPDTPTELMQESLPDLIPNFGVDSLARVVTGEIDNKFYNIFINMDWFVKDFSLNKKNILTCDNPHYRSFGLQDSKCIFAIPLNSKKVFFAVHKKDYKHKIFKTPAEKLIDTINLTMVHQAYNWVIDVDEKNKQMIQDNFGKSRKRMNIFFEE